MRPDEIEACLDVWDKSFEHTPREYFRRYFDGDPWFKPEYTRVCEDEGQIVSIVQICRREVRYGAATLIMGGIANVGTPPEFRGRGYSSETMKSAIDVMINERMDFSMLFTGINAFYEKVAYVTIENTHGVGKLKPEVPQMSLPYDIRPYSSEDADAIVTLYNDYNSLAVFPVVRTLAYWSGFAVDPRSSNYDIWVAKADKDIKAYLLGHKYGKSYAISEMACKAGHEFALLALAQAAWLKAVDSKSEDVVYRLPKRPEINTAIDSIATGFTSRLHTGMMLRVIDLQSLFMKILPELARRSAGLTHSGRITISTEYGVVTLDTSPGRVVMVDEQADEWIELDHRGLLSLVFGYKPAQEVVSGLDSTNPLSVLFPKQETIFYPVDGF